MTERAIRRRKPGPKRVYQDSSPRRIGSLPARLIQSGLFAFSILAACGLALAIFPALAEPTRLYPIITALVLAKSLTFELFRLQRACWRWFDLPDAAVITVANTAGSVLAAVALGPRVIAADLAAIVLIDWFVSQALLIGSPLLFRLHRDNQERCAWTQPRKRILIYGAHARGVRLLRRIRDNPASRYEVAGFIDDAPGYRHATIQMTPVLGSAAELPRLARLHDIDRILVPGGTRDLAARARIAEFAAFARVPCRFLRRRKTRNGK